MKKPLTEFIGTFFLVLTICLAVQSGNPLAVLAIGVVLMCLVYMGGHVSGAHYNPAVSTALMLAKKMPGKDFGGYLVAQLVGGFAGAYVGWWLTGRSTPIAPGAGVPVAQALLAEVLFTFLLALVVLNVAASSKTEGKGFYGLAIGFTVVAAALAAGPISGGAFNPAVGIGLTLSHMMNGGGAVDQIWLYIVGPLVGGALAAMVFGVQEAPDPA